MWSNPVNSTNSAYGSGALVGMDTDEKRGPPPSQSQPQPDRQTWGSASIPPLQHHQPQQYAPYPQSQPMTQPQITRGMSLGKIVDGISARAFSRICVLITPDASRHIFCGAHIDCLDGSQMDMFGIDPRDLSQRIARQLKREPPQSTIHEFVKWLHQEGLLFACIDMGVDRIFPADNRQIIKWFGSVTSPTACQECGAAFPRKLYEATLRYSSVVKCLPSPDCNGYVRPNFAAAEPDADTPDSKQLVTAQRARQALQQCDLFLSFGAPPTRDTMDTEDLPLPEFCGDLPAHVPRVIVHESDEQSLFQTYSRLLQPGRDVSYAASPDVSPDAMPGVYGSFAKQLRQRVLGRKK